MIGSIEFAKRICAFAGMAIFGFTRMAYADVVISTQPTENMSCSAGICTPTAPKAILNVVDLANLLASGDVKVVSDSTAIDIRFAAPLSWTSASRLTLDSYRSIAFQQAVAVAGSGAVSITTNDGGTGGFLSFDTAGSVSFWDLQSNLTMNGTTYALVDSVAALASAIKADRSGNFALARPYDAAPDGIYHQAPIAVDYLGWFLGMGNRISNLRIVDKRKGERVGLFAELDGSIAGLRVDNARVAGGDTDNGFGYAGVLAGEVTDRGTISQSSASGKLSAGTDDFVGGLVGLNSGTILRSSSAVSVSSSEAYNLGGLAGGNFGTIRRSSATGKVTGNYRAGGLVGYGYSAIIHSFATGNVSGSTAGGLAAVSLGPIIRSAASGAISVSRTTDGNAGGGLVASNSGEILKSYATGAVSGVDNSTLGGLIGTNAPDSSGILSDSYATGAVLGGSHSRVGGLIGATVPFVAPSTIGRVYSTGAVEGGTSDAGGLIGYDDESGQKNSFSSAYWNLDTSGIGSNRKGAGNIDNDPGITGMTDSQLKSALPSGFDPKRWGQNPKINNGYPYVLANPPPK